MERFSVVIAHLMILLFITFGIMANVLENVKCMFLINVRDMENLFVYLGNIYVDGGKLMIDGAAFSVIISFAVFL